MAKNFSRWSYIKPRIHERQNYPIYIHEREIWWASLGLNIGYEQDGKNENFERPVLIIKKFNRFLVWIIPLTSTGKNNPYYYQFSVEKSHLVLSQIKTISTKRLLRYTKKISQKEFETILDKIKNLFPETRNLRKAEVSRGTDVHY